MGRQIDLLQLNNSLDATPFRFTLSNDFYGVHVLKYAPDGYLPEQFEFSRDMEHFGVFRKFTQNELKFVKDGRDYLQNCYESFGVNAEVSLKVEALNPDTLTYSEKFTGTIDFSTYKINEIAVSVQIIDGLFIQKIMNREGVKVNLLASTSIDGNYIGSITKEIITIPGLNINQNAIWEGSGGYYTDAEHIMPVELITTEYGEAVTPDTSKTGAEAGLFINSLEAYTDLYFRGRISAEMQFEEVQPRARIQWILTRYDSSGVWQEDILLHQEMQDFVDVLLIDISFDEVVPIQIGDTLTFRCNILQGVNYNLTYYDIFAEINKVITVLPSRTVYGLLYHEAFERIVAQYTGQINKVYSDFFGRTDIGYLADGTLGGITNGRFIRKIYDVNQTLSTSLKDLFKSLSLYCIGIGEIDGKLRIEPMRYWFKDDIILDLSDRIATETIEKEVIPELLSNSLKIGYNGFDYDRTGGIYEYNTLSEWSTILKLDNSFQLVSAYRADMSGMLKAIAETDHTKDSSADNNIFMLDLVRDPLHYTVRTNEGFDYATGGADTEQNYNLLLTPARTLRRWGSYLRAMLDRWQLSYIRWQASEKSTTLRTRVTGETEVSESADIQVQDLDNPIWHPEKYIVKAYVTRDELAAVTANPLGIVKLADDKFGWILDFKVQNNDFEVELSLLRVNTAYVTPIEMAPTITDALELTFDNIANVPVADANSVSDWNTFFDLPTYGNPFTSVIIDGNKVKLIGGSEITLKDSLFGNSGYGSNLLAIEDFANCITVINYNVFGDNIAYSEGCYNLVNARFPAVISVGEYAFSYCEVLVSLFLPNCIALSQYCFDNCTGLTSINIPFERFVILNDGVFNNCPLLENVSFPNVIEAGYGCFSGTTIDPNLLLPNVIRLGDGCFLLCNTFINVSMPFVEEIGDYCFSDCTGINSFSFPSCTKIGIDVDQNMVFNSIFGQTITLTVPAALMTCNGGNPDGDIQYLMDNNTVTVITV